MEFLEDIIERIYEEQRLADCLAANKRRDEFDGRSGAASQEEPVSGGQFPRAGDAGRRPKDVQQPLA
jgi:hypothetical protein